MTTGGRCGRAATRFPGEGAAKPSPVPAAASRSDEAVSEIVGYLFIFGIVMSAISIVYVNAFPVLQRSQDQSYLANVDQSFRVLSFNINRIMTSGPPSQSIEVKLKDSTISVLGKSNLNVAWRNDSLQNDTTGAMTLLTVEHLFSDRKIAYEGGGVWVKTSDGGVATLAVPNWILGNATDIFYSTLSTSNASRSGTGLTDIELVNSCRVLGQCAPTTVQYINASRVTLNVTSEYCLGWEHYFERTWGFQAAHFDGSVCGSNNRLVANVSAWLGGVNATLYLTQVSVEGYLR